MKLLLDEMRILGDNIKMHILDKYLLWIIRSGARHIGIDELADEIGVSVGTIKKYYSCEEEIIDDAVKRASNLSNEALISVINTPLSPRRKMEILTSVIMSGISRNHGLAEEFVFMGQLQISSTFSKRVEKYNNMPVFCVSKIIEEGQECGDIIQGDPLYLSKVFWGFIQGVCINYITIGNEFEIPSAEMINKFLWAPNSAEG
ncbi:TetR/AcrR family transcriptional regulator [Clostridium sp. LP20]|uniref:TetR/AcrR family transcriptional regulator n=1 Tax=Clostridium sp. LP20 TaxID=3418665 RepID=UPI003EE76F65